MLVWGVGGGVGTAALAIAKALGARVLATSSSDAKLERARELGADAVVQPRDGGRASRRRSELTGGAGIDVVVEHVGEATWKTSLAGRAHRRPDRRLRRDDGPEPAGAAPPDLVEAALRSSARRWARRETSPRRYELVASGRAQPVIDRVFPLAEVRAAHEHLESGEQFGKVVLSI